MRYVDLRIKKRKSSVNSVLKFGCGPNFVRNRPEAFAKMIKDQGVVFWFRFWLSFCLQHGIKEFDEIDQELSGWNISLLKNLHNNFVQVSVEQAIDYCWNIIFENGRPMKRFLDEIYQFVALEFACALGEVFFKWLIAEDYSNPSTKEYWIIPEEYLDSNFHPRPLEKFLVLQWGKRLVQLFGVSRDDVTWVRVLLIQKEEKPICDYSMEFAERAKLIRKQYEDTWKKKLISMRRAIESADELRKLNQNRAGTKIIRITGEGKKKLKCTKVLPPPQCSCCGSYSPVRKCQVCVDEEWPHPTYYCGITCQSKDWYLKHKKEHYKHMKRRKCALERAANQKLIQDSEKSLISSTS